jgi:hypothetical protein
MISKKKLLLLFSLLLFILVYIIIYTNKTSYRLLIPHVIKNATIITNPYNYNLILEPSKSMCIQFNQDDKLLIFIFVVSSPDAHNIRHIIRKTWANSTMASKNFKMIFTIGLSKDKRSNEILKLENKIYNDILQGDLIDSYHVITIKDMLALNWINNHCPNTHFVSKVADDVLVNINQLVLYLNNNLNNRNTIFGYMWQNAYPKRDNNSLWFVTFEEFKGNVYDPFPSGTALILTNDLSKSFYDYALGFPVPPFSVWMDDVYFGMIGARLNTRFVDIIDSYVPRDHYAAYSVDEKIELIKENHVNKTLFVFAKERDYYHLWMFLNKYYNK